MTNIQQDT